MTEEDDIKNVFFNTESLSPQKIKKVPAFKEGVIYVLIGHFALIILFIIMTFTSGQPYKYSLPFYILSITVKQGIYVIPLLIYFDNLKKQRKVTQGIWAAALFTFVLAPILAFGLCIGIQLVH